MTSSSVARDTATATLFVAFLAAIERHPHRWRWPDQTSEYLQHRVETLAADLVQTSATMPEVA